MATATSVRQSTTPKMAPPPLPMIQTSLTSSSNSRPVRQRKEPHRSSARSMSRTLADGSDGVSKPLREPYVRTSSHILRKFKGYPPSLRIHLHSSYFRFDMQDGTFSYNSPMRSFLEHISAQTIPHDMLEELEQGGVTFYDGCLIVEVHDHKSAVSNTNHPTKGKSDSSRLKLFSLHHQEGHLRPHVTPSAYVPYPSPATTPRQSASPPSQQQEGVDASTRVSTNTRTKIYTTVLHPTAISRHRDLLIMASTALPEPRFSNKKNQAAAAAARESATPLTAYPPTPLSALPPPLNTKGHPTKRRRMRLEEDNVHEFESEVLKNTEPMLFLEPAGDFEDCQAIIKSLAHPLHSHIPPHRAGRKRTFAELAADEAQAAEEERIALIGDGRLKPSLNAAGSGTTAPGDGHDAAKEAAADFTWIKTLEDIQRRQNAAKAEDLVATNNRKVEEQREKDRRAEEDRLKREREQQIAKQAHHHAQVVAAQAQAANQAQTPHARSANTIQQQMMQNLLQQQAGHGQQSSPMMAGQSPMSASPTSAHPLHAQQGLGVQMGVSMQSHGVESPRPGSAMQIHPGMAQPMSQQGSQQQNHLGQSRTSTPQIPMMTPQMGSSMPAHHMTPQRQNHGSPSIGIQNPNMNGITPRANGNQVNTAQAAPYAQFLQKQQQEMMQRRRMISMNSPQPNGGQMSPQQQAAFLAAQQMQQQGSPHFPNMPNGTSNSQNAAAAEYRRRMTMQQLQQQNVLQNQLQQRHGAAMNNITSGAVFPANMATASNMSRQASQQQFSPQQQASQQSLQQNQQPMQTPNIQRQLPQQQSQFGPGDPTANPGMSAARNDHQQDGATVARNNMQAKKAEFFARLANQNGGQLPPNAEQLFSNWVANYKSQQYQKMRANQIQHMHHMQQQNAIAAQMQQQGQPGTPQQQQQQGFNGQMSPQQQAAMRASQAQQQRLAAGMPAMQSNMMPTGDPNAQAEYLARLHRQTIMLRAQAQAASNRGMNTGMNGGMPMGQQNMQGMQRMNNAQGRGGG